ncbi:MAG: DUF2332 domain-containing protein [Pseudomonadota bacterium]
MSQALSAHAAHFRKQAEWCDVLGSPFNASLLRALADRLGDGSVLDHLLVGGETPLEPAAADAGPLRLAGALHALALKRQDAGLAAQYPGERPDWDMGDVLPAVYEALQAHKDWVAGFLKNTPQTNETRRAIALLPGFAALEGPLHLLELGASAGLNQHWDAFGYDGGHWSRPGAPEAPTITSVWEGPAPSLPEQFEIASRKACDQSPLDVEDPEARLALQAYVWPDQTDRLQRVRKAIALARQSGVHVEACDAAEWLDANLSGPLPLGTTVVFHSIAWQYFDSITHNRAMAAIRDAGARANADHRFAWLRFENQAVFEPGASRSVHQVDLISWPGAQHRVIAHADPHGGKVIFAP